MDSLERMNQALAYIEENLAGEIDFKKVERLAQCSEYHFRRMFSFLAGVTLSEYIRRRRLTLAAFVLIQGNALVTDTALKYGYHSPDAFTRAFQALHGVTPAEAIWQSLDTATIQRLKALSDTEPRGLISASANFSEGRLEGGELDQYIGVATTREPPQDLARLEVPATTWAVFESVGPFPETLQNTWARIYSEWFPASGYELSKGPEILWDENKEMDSPAFRSEIWIPVSKRP